MWLKWPFSKDVKKQRYKNPDISLIVLTCMLRILIIIKINAQASTHKQHNFSCSFAVLWGLCLVILNKILRFTIFHVKLQKMSEMLDIYNNNSTCVLANMYNIVNIIAMLCIFYADNNNKEPADKCKLMNLMTNSLFPGFGILL